MSHNRADVASRTARLVVALVALAVAAVGLPPATAATREFAPVGQPGPALEPSRASLEQAVACTSSVGVSKQDPVVFVPGTTLTPREDFAWNWFRALDRLSIPYCAVTIPGNTTGDVQVSAQYVVHGIRTAHRLSGKRVSVLGHSQGGMLPRVALRFWPDLRPMVDDVVSFAATNHGSPVISAMCVPVCMASLWQQREGSQLLQAVNSRQETFRGISYTQLYTRLDQFVQPNLDDTGTSSLRTGDGEIRNIALQEVCPTNTAEHLAIGTYDPLAYALTMDALTHRGPADPGRVDAAVCRQTLMPGVDPATFPTDYAGAGAVIAQQLTVGPKQAAEPPLKPWVYARR